MSTTRYYEFPGGSRKADHARHITPSARKTHLKPHIVPPPASSSLPGSRFTRSAVIYPSRLSQKSPLRATRQLLPHTVEQPAAADLLKLGLLILVTVAFCWILRPDFLN